MLSAGPDRKIARSQSDLAFLRPQMMTDNSKQLRAKLKELIAANRQRVATFDHLKEENPQAAQESPQFQTLRNSAINLDGYG